MVEQVPSKYTPPSITVPGWPDLEAPYPCENEISRHVYVKDKRPATFTPVLYNHNAIKQSRSDTIFYVESELEVDQLGALGLLATTYGRPAAVPLFQNDLLRGRTVLAVGRAGADGEVHVNAVKNEYSSVATVRTLMVDHPTGVTTPGYRLADWLQDTAGEDQRGWLMAVARGEHHPGRLPLKGSGGPVEAFSHPDESKDGDHEKAVQKAPVRSAEVLLFGTGAQGQIGTPTANHSPRPIQRPTRPGIVFSNDPCAGSEPAWLVKDVLPETGTGMLYAPSKAGKSFVGIALCHAVANGIDWAGRQVKQGCAIYVASEHSTSVCRRSCSQFEFQDLDKPFAIIQADSLGHRLSDDGKGVEMLIEDIDHARGEDDVRLVFIDTFETIALGADENSSSAVGQVWDCIVKISARFNCFVLVAHHTCKDSRNYRGSSTLMNRPETVIAINELANDRRRLTIEKQRDGRSGFTAEFELETIPGTSSCCPVFVKDWHLKEETSASHSGHPERAPKARKGEQIQSAILEALQDVRLRTGEERVSKDELRQHESILPCITDLSNEAARKALDRALESLEKKNKISLIGSYISLSDTDLSCPDMSGNLSRQCA